MIKHHTKYSSYETVRLAVALLPVTGAPSGISPEQLEDICSADDPSESWELIDAAAPSGTNEYGGRHLPLCLGKRHLPAEPGLNTPLRREAGPRAAS